MTSPFPIVGIGASAGGLEALQALVAAIPNDTGIAYVIVQHLAPDHPSIMDKLLRDYTRLPVTQIGNGDAIEPDHIYLIPPGPFLELKGGRFRLIEHAREEGVRTPIDRFFTSLADQCGRDGFAVVLSGTGSDGTLGLRSVNMAGGVALVQDSRTARFPGMPDSAVATGLVDFALAPEAMPGRILDILEHRNALAADDRAEELQGAIANGLPEILSALDPDAQHGFHSYKPPTLVRRILRRMTILRQASVDGYIAKLTGDADERDLLAKDFLIGVTEFFRDPDVYASVERDVVAKLVAQGGEDPIRIWVPGCATGEEAYSLAILLCEEMDRQGKERHCQVFGTDIDMNALRHARGGVYSSMVVSHISPDRMARFFQQASGGYQVSNRLRQMCVFAPHDILSDPPFSRLDMISCRNVMIYLTGEAQHGILPRFHYGLQPGGYLLLGPSESLGRNDELFHFVDRNARLFQRNDQATTRFTALAARPPRVPPIKEKSADLWETPPTAATRQTVEMQAEQAFLQNMAPPFALVDPAGGILYLSEAMTAFVKPRRGAPELNIDSFLSRELRLPIQAALNEARDGGAPAEARNVISEAEGETRLYDILAKPLPEDENHAILLSLREVRLRDGAEVEPSADRAADSAFVERKLAMAMQHIEVMERDHSGTEQQLRSANEELLSMNEEMQSSNEELETSREELQSINEELETINADLSENNRRLARANSDMRNLLESTDIATLFLDANLRVRLFTPPLAKLYGVRDRDIGRDITELASRVAYPELPADAAAVMQTLQPVDREVKIDVTGQCFAVRIRPYRTIDDRLDGTVVTFVDITTRKQNQEQLEENARVLREQYAELETLYNSIPVGLSLVDTDLRYLRINPSLADINGFAPEDHIGKSQKELLPNVTAEVEDLQRRVFETGEPVFGLEVSSETPKAPGVERIWLVDFFPVKDGEHVFAVGSCVVEITEQRALELNAARDAAAIIESQARMARLFDQAPSIISIFEGPEMRYSYVNAAHDAAVGIPAAELLGKPVREAVPQLQGQGIIERFERVYQTGKEIETHELAAQVNADGQTQYYKQIIRPWYQGDGAVGGVMSFTYDITELVAAREQVARGEKRLRTIQDSLQSFVGLLDTSGTLIEANELALVRVGATRNDVIGQKFWDCPWWSYDPAMQAQLQGWIERALNGEPIREECRLWLKGDVFITVDFQLIPSFDDDGRVNELIPSAIDITEWRAAEARKDTLLAELQHRVKNVLATVQAIARFTARTAPDKDSLIESLQQRLAAISRTHDGLTQSDWTGKHLFDIVRDEVSPYVGDASDRLVLNGEDVLIEPGNTLSIALALHELATNAAKYGALSNSTGTVTVTVRSELRALKAIEWRETGGPLVEAQGTSGFGSFLLERVLTQDLDATVDLKFDPSGAICIIEFT